MSYSIDFNKISLSEYKEMIKTANLLPGRKIFLENIDEIFLSIEQAKIETLSQLSSILSTKKKIASFSEKTNISEECLTILRREINSMKPKLVLLRDLDVLDAAKIEQLKSIGILSTEDYYSLFLSSDKAKLLAIIDMDTQNYLQSLCDFLRINGVGIAAAKTLCNTPLENIQQITKTDATALLEMFLKSNAEKQYYKANLGIKDMNFLINATKTLLKYS